MEPIARLEAGVDLAGSVISRVEPNQYNLSTPCTEWNVRDLVNHMIGGMVMFRDGARGVIDPDAVAGDLIGADAAESFRTNADAAVAGWSEAGKLDGNANLLIGEFPAYFALQLPSMDLLVHSWDLARATGLSVDWNPELVSSVKPFVEETFSVPQSRGDAFADPVPVSDDADDLSKIVAFLGRNP